MKDVELISARLRRVEQLCKLPNSVLQQLALCGYYEDLEKGVTRKFVVVADYNCVVVAFGQTIDSDGSVTDAAID